MLVTTVTANAAYRKYTSRVILPLSIAEERAAMKSILKLLNDDAGATAIEYGLIAALISVAAIAAMGNVGNNLQSIFNTVANNLNT